MILAACLSLSEWTFALVLFVVSFFFFFQAEDGIRDPLVTGVQTCALPICAKPDAPLRVSAWVTPMHCFAGQPPSGPILRPASSGQPRRQTSCAGRSLLRRSEERRVGKECRYRGAR